MNLQKTTFYLFTLISLVLTSCSSDDENKNDTQVLVTVISADDKPLSNEIVQMFDEKTYEEFKKDNRTTPTAYALTNSKGVATFIFGEFYQFNLSSCIRQQNSLTAQFVSFSLANLANIFYPPRFLQ